MVSRCSDDEPIREQRIACLWMTVLLRGRGVIRVSYLGSLIKVCDISLYFLKCFQSCAAAQLAVQARRSGGAVQAQSGGAVQAQSGAVQAQSGAVKAQSGAVQAQSGAVQAQSGAVQAQSGAVQAWRGSSAQSLTARPRSCLKAMRIHWECSQNDHAIVRVFFGL